MSVFDGEWVQLGVFTRDSSDGGWHHGIKEVLADPKYGRGGPRKPEADENAALLSRKHPDR